MSDLGNSLGAQPLDLVSVVISACVLYLAFAVLLTWAGQRIFASPSALDLAVVALLGAVVGRSILGPDPSLLGGLAALATLVVLESATGRLRRSAVVRRRLRQRAEAVVVAGRIEPGAVRRHGVDEEGLWTALRTAGVRGLDDVVLMVLEPNGRYSVIRAGTPVSAAALTGLKRRDEIADRLRRAGLLVDQA